MSLLNKFCHEFGIAESALGTITRIGPRCFLTMPEQKTLIEEHRKELFSVGIFLGEEKRRFEPSPALFELIAAKGSEHTAVVDEKAAWLFLCGRDLFTKGILEQGTPTKNGYLFIQNEQGENLGYGHVVKGKGNVAIKNDLDRGYFLRRERMK